MMVTVIVAVWMIFMLLPLGVLVGYATDYSPLAGLFALVAGCFAVIGSAMLIVAVA